MGISDVIYGVTMGEPGVSRKVSVKFSDLHEKGYVTDDAAEGRPSADLSRGPAAATVAPAAVEPAAEAAGYAELAQGQPAPGVSRGSHAPAPPAEAVTPATVAEAVERG